MKKRETRSGHLGEMSTSPINLRPFVVAFLISPVSTATDQITNATRRASMGKRARWDKLDNLAVLVGHPAAPGLVWFHHPHHLASVVEPELPARCVAARIDAVEHHNQRLVYSGILNRIAAALEQEDSEHAGKEVLSWDAFVRGLRGLWSVRVEQARVRSRKRAEAEASKVVENGDEVGEARKEEEEEGQIVIIVMNAERLRSVLNAEWAAFTRLSELVGL